MRLVLKAIDLVWKTVNLVFDTLKVSLLAWNQESGFKSSPLAVEDNYSRLLENLRKPLSSGNRKVKKDVQSGNSLMYSKKRKGS